MKLSAYFVFMCLLLYTNIYKATAQSLSLFDIDTSGYPLLKGKFVAVDEKHNQIVDITKKEASIVSGGVQQEITKVINPQPSPPLPLSLVLTVDISQSMNENNIVLAKKSLTALIKTIPLNLSQCAITSFDDLSYVNTDFTRDRNSLMNVVESLKPDGGTDYQSALAQPAIGALDIAKKGFHKKVIIFITDGLGNVNENEIIQYAKQNGITIYCLTLNMKAPDALKKISAQTGGDYYEDVMNTESATDLFLRILYKEQKSEPSIIEWVNKRSCVLENQLFMKVPERNLMSSPVDYFINKKFVVQLRPDSYTITLEKNTNKKLITLYAENDDITLLSYKSSNPLFKMDGSKFPSVIKKGTAYELMLVYEAVDSSYQETEINLLNDACEPVTIFVQNSAERPREDKLLKVVSPNGGELFYAGTDTCIKWTGVSAAQPVDIFLSPDNAKSWNPVANSVTGLKYAWHVPKIFGNKMLVKAILSEEGGESKNDYPVETKEYVSNVKFNKNGTRAIVLDHRNVYIIDTKAGVILKTIDPNLGYMNDVGINFSEDGKLIYIYNNAFRITNIYDAKTGDKISPSSHNNYKRSYDSDNSIYADYDRTINSIIVHKTKSSKALYELPTAKTIGHNTCFASEHYLLIGKSPYDGKNISLELWGESEKTKISTIPIPLLTEKIIKCYITEDERYIVAAFQLKTNDKSIQVYDLKTSKKTFAISNFYCSDEAIDIKGNLFVYSDNRATNIFVCEIATGKVVKKFTHTVGTFWISSTISHVALNSTGTHIFFLNIPTQSNTNYIYNAYAISTGYHASLGDNSDSVFSILKPTLIVQDIRMIKTVVGKYKDSTITTAMINNHPVSIQVKQMILKGQDAAAFYIVSGNAPCSIPSNKNGQFELRFKPLHAGFHNATLWVITESDTSKIKLSGEGFLSTLAVRKIAINFGKVKVGILKDSLIKTVIKNTGAVAVNISNLSFSQKSESFSLSSYSDFTLAPGETKNINATFKPSARGIQTATIICRSTATSEILKINMYGEGIAPAEYKLNTKILLSENGNAIRTDIRCADIEAPDSPLKLYENNTDTSYTTSLHADRKYLLIAKKENYRAVYDTIDLSNQAVESVINKTLVMIKENKPVTLYGKVMDKKTKLLLVAEIECRDPENNKIIKKLVTTEDGKYKITLPGNTKYRFVISKKQYLTEATTVDLKGAEEQAEREENFLLSALVVGEVISLNNVYFERSKPTLLIESYEQLNVLAQLLLDNKNIHIDLAGHTDKQGDEKANLKLSEDRVQTIKAYLTEKGIEASRITGKGYGSRKPVASNNSEETRKLNRRVEFKIVKM